MPSLKPILANDQLGAAIWSHAQLPLSCVRQEYPNRIGHHMLAPGSEISPMALTPSFYGCYDWHSAVHGHWGIVRALRTLTDNSQCTSLRAALEENLAAERLLAELKYSIERPGFEVPYGRAWLLQWLFP